jgi:hypothetical protein
MQGQTKNARPLPPLRSPTSGSGLTALRASMAATAHRPGFDVVEFGHSDGSRWQATGAEEHAAGR